MISGYDYDYDYGKVQWPKRHGDVLVVACCLLLVTCCLLAKFKGRGV